MLIRAILLLAVFVQGYDTRDAARLGRTPDDAMYAAWTRGYQLAVSEPVTSAEIITEYRRAVLIVREHMQKAEVGFTDHELGIAMKPYLGQVTFIVSVAFHPLNTFTRMPLYDLYVSSGARTDPIASERVRRDPVYALGGPGAPLVGVRLEITVPRDRLAVASAPELVVTDEKADVIWRGRIDLSRYR